MKSENKWKVQLIAVVILFLGWRALWWYNYQQAINEVSKEWYREEYLNKEIKGVLESMNEFDGDPLKVVLSIENTHEKFAIRYGVTCVDQKFRQFVTPGDSVFKTSGEKTIHFCKTKTKECKNFELNFCSNWSE